LSLPLIRLSGFFQVDDGLFSQTPASRATPAASGWRRRHGVCDERGRTHELGLQRLCHRADVLGRHHHSLFHVELAAKHGAAHFQTETMHQLGGPTMVMPTAYFQCGYFLTGEYALSLKQPGVE